MLHDVVFLIDVDNTLVDNDRIADDLRQHLVEEFGEAAGKRYWAHFEDLRKELGYADYLGALQRYRADVEDKGETAHRLLMMSGFLLDYPFVERVYPNALEVLAALGKVAPTVILSDGDVVFQPRKVARSGIWEAVEGRVLIFIHKEEMLATIEREYPATHYVLIDDKPRLLDAIKAQWGDRLTTVFPRQGHYAREAGIEAKYRRPDVIVEAIGDLLRFDMSKLARLRPSEKDFTEWKATPMDGKKLIGTCHALMDGKRGLIAMDESLPTCNKRFAKLGIPQTEEMRRAYRDMIATTPRLGESISGAILFDETIRQKTLAGVPFAEALEKAKIVPGIKVDAGSKPLAGFEGEETTEGLDGLRDRLAEYAKMGARFAKWRAVITIGDGTPTDGAIAANALSLARYAALCQEAGIVPIVEPEVLMDGDHTLDACIDATTRTLHAVFDALHEQRVMLEGALLKPNMVLPGLKAKDQSSADAIADATVHVFLRTVPAAIGGIAFLSGGQSAEDASARLNAMHKRFAGGLPWPLTFSFSRAIQQPALDKWAGKTENVKAAQDILRHRAECNAAARAGRYDPDKDVPIAA